MSDKDLITEKEREKLLAYYNKLKDNDDRLAARNIDLVNKNKESVDKVFDLFDLLEEKKKERLKMSDREKFAYKATGNLNKGSFSENGEEEDL